MALNAIIDYLPSPLEVDNYQFVSEKDKNDKIVEKKEKIECSDKSNFVGFAFKLE